MIWNENPLMGWKGFSFLSHLSLNIILFPVSVLAFIALRTSKETGLRILRALFIGFIPLFLLYGGRYVWHLAPFIYIFPVLYISNQLFARKKKQSLTAKAVGIIAICFLLVQPLPQLVTPPQENGGYIGWDFTAIDLPLLGVDGFQTTSDFSDVLTFLHASVPRNAIVSAHTSEIGAMVSFFTGLKNDQGLFWENTNPKLWEDMNENRTATRPYVFIYSSPNISYQVDHVYTFGEYNVGVRL